MATMHQKDSPLTSGRTVLWRTTPVLLLSPLISSLVTGYDVEIYLAVGYGFILLLLFQYRMLCREWAGWMDNIPKFTEPDILAWYSSRLQKQRPNDYDSSRASVASHDQDSPDVVRRSALEKFRACVEAHGWDLLSFRNTKDQDSLVTRVAKGLPYVEWLLRMEGEGKEDTEVFSVPWFAQLTEALKKRQQMVQGLKEHSIFMLFRYSSLDVSTGSDTSLESRLLTLHRLDKTSACFSYVSWTDGSASSWLPTPLLSTCSQISPPDMLSVLPLSTFVALSWSWM